MTEQEIFETGVRHMFEQGERSIGDDGTCQYRQKGTENCCVVGKFIPDDKYTPKMEGLDAEELISNFRGHLPEVITGNSDLMMELQGIHDQRGNWKTTESMRQAVRESARFWESGLNADFVDALSFRDR